MYALRASLFFLWFCLPVQNAAAFTAEQLPQEFDARQLTEQEKRFLQAGLAFQNHYNGMIDGAWGQASQTALERHLQANGGTMFVTNADVLFVAIDTFEALDSEGWERQYYSGLDMSFLVPTKVLVEGARSDNFVNMNVTGRSIGYSMTIDDGRETQGYHEYTAGQAIGDVYTVRRPTLWITSARTADGISLYTRSDYRRGVWSTLMISASDSDAGAFAAITGSIAPGYAPAIGISPGRLAVGIETLSRIVQDREAPEASAVTEEVGVAAPEEPPPAGFGTGFIVSAQGHLVTNRHVVTGCARLSVDGQSAEVVAEDAVFDLALLRVEALSGAKPAEFAADAARLNSDVTVAGFPLPELLGGLNVTRGSVTSLKGMGGDGINMQISAPVQPGNSGGPVLNAAGQVVGVVVSKLDVAYALKTFDDIPQNVNFAIRGEIAKLFLSQNGIDPLIAVADDGLPPETLAEVAQAFTRLVTCN
jgi:serine protease Do